MKAKRVATVLAVTVLAVVSVAAAAVIDGTEGDDTIVGTRGADLISGL